MQEEMFNKKRKDERVGMATAYTQKHSRFVTTRRKGPRFSLDHSRLNDDIIPHDNTDYLDPPSSRRKLQ